jgi:hypothetical protein
MIDETLLRWGKLPGSMFPGRGAARSGEPLIRDRSGPESATIPGLQRTTPLRSVLHCARETRLSELEYRAPQPHLGLVIIFTAA